MTDEELRKMTDDEIMRLLVRLNNAARLVILDGADNLQPFYAVATPLGYHRSTQQFVFQAGVRINQPGEDFEAREPVVWQEE